jgi:hypothetical protein
MSIDVNNMPFPASGISNVPSCSFAFCEGGVIIA